MGLDIPDYPPKCPAPGMAMLGSDMMLMIDQTKIPILQLHTVDATNMPGVVAHQSHIIGIRHDYRETFPVNRRQFFRGKHDHRLTPGAATI